MNTANSRKEGCVGLRKMFRGIMSRLCACIPCTCACPHSCTVTLTVNRKPADAHSPTYPSTTIRNELHDEFRCSTPPLKTKDASQQTDEVRRADVGQQTDAAEKRADTDFSKNNFCDINSSSSDDEGDAGDAGSSSSGGAGSGRGGAGRRRLDRQHQMEGLRLAHVVLHVSKGWQQKVERQR